MRKIRNKRAFKRLVDQGLSPALAHKTIIDIIDLGYSAEVITKKHSATEIRAIIDSVERALKFHLENDSKKMFPCATKDQVSDLKSALFYCESEERKGAQHE